MNIMLITNEFPPIGAGASNAAFFIGRELIRKGHRAVVMTSRYKNCPDNETVQGIEVNRIRTPRRRIDRSNLYEIGSFGLSSVLSIHKVASINRIDQCIAFFTLPSGIGALFLKLIKNVPYIVSLRGGDVPGFVPELNGIHFYIRYLRHKILSLSKAVVANSHGLKTLSEKYDPHPVIVIPNGVDADFFNPLEKPSCRKKRFRFLYVGRFTKQKNLFFLLEQMNIVSNLCAVDFEIHLVGGGPDETSLMSYSKYLDIHNRIHWHGWTTKNELRKHYQDSDCLLLPSLYEGMSNSLLEAMACNLPVVASDIPANNQVVVDGETGFLFKLDASEEFQKCIVQILNDNIASQQMGQNGRARVLKHFTWEQVSEKYLGLLAGGRCGF